MSDDAASLRLLKRHLAPIRVLSVEHARLPGQDSVSFLFAGLWFLAGAELVLANSRSNMGVALFTLAAVRKQRVPAAVDMDGEWSSRLMLDGFFPCFWEWGSRRGLCRRPPSPKRAAIHADWARRMYDVSTKTNMRSYVGLMTTCGKAANLSEELRVQSAADCARWCDADAACLAFDTNAKSCILKSRCEAHVGRCRSQWCGYGKRGLRKTSRIQPR
eukprot:TRINITY_DN22628_c0_g1_i3.p1 TRINITY_DN22628_c0_g1~~TRINITY_DN22628_c0_g1_i3.p1  ORF type:complete len:246 (-),score=12.61 TRINITY_DN22628_c0_g1_i3:535-1185(-)